MTRPMSWWNDKSRSTAAVAEPEPVVDRFEEAMAEFRQIEAELLELNLACRTFRTAHKIQLNRFGQIVGFQGELTARKAIEGEWRLLQQRMEKLFPRRNALLYEIAELKKGSK